MLVLSTTVNANISGRANFSASAGASTSFDPSAGVNSSAYFLLHSTSVRT